jgi:hypothetical protein
MGTVKQLVLIAVGIAIFSATLISGRYALHASEYDIDNSGYPYSSAKLSLGCDSGAVQIWFQWNTKVGDSEAVLRHGFDAGNENVLLPTFAGGMSTGFMHSDGDAKALIAYLMQSKAQLLSVRVLPEGANPASDEKWKQARFKITEFHKAVRLVAKECHWDVSAPQPSTLRIVPASTASSARG